MSRKLPQIAMQDSVYNLSIQAGTLLFREGDAGDFACLIMGGEIEVFVTREGCDVVLARRGAGEIIGEMAIIDHRPRSASARVVADCRLLLIAQGQIERRIAATDPVLRMCLGVIIDRYRESLSLVQAGAEASKGPAAQGVPLPGFQAAVEVLSLERDLERALREREFEVYFQPIVRLSNRRLEGFEALSRWNHPERGLLSPAEFIPVAEVSGSIVAITDRCLREVARALPALDAAAGRERSQAEHGSPALFVSVNVSARDLTQGLPENIRSILADAGVPAESIKLEVTESMLMKDPSSARRVLQACRDSGVGIAIDDFGTGHSSLSYLGSLPITTLKIDRAFVSSMSGDDTSRKIVSTILHLARELDLSVVAEGVEDEAEAQVLGAMGCDFGQGYLFGRPAPLSATLDLARAWPSRAGKPLAA